MAADLNVIYRIAADITGLESGVQRAAKATESLESKVTALGKTIVEVFAARKVIGLVEDVIQFGSHLTDLSQRLGVSTDAIQKWQLAFGQAGISVDAVATASTKLAKNLTEGDKGAVNVLEKLGLNVQQLKQLAPDDLFNRVADAVGKIPSPTEKAFAAMTLFGKGGAELLAGLDGHLQETTAEFERMGLIIDKETIKAADDFGDKLSLLKQQLIAVLAQALSPLLPMLTSVANGLLVVAKVVGTVGGEIVKWLYGGLLSAVSAIEKFLATIANAAQKIPLLGKHLGLLGDAAEWLRKDAAAADTQLVKLFTSADALGESAQKSTPKLLGLGKATDDGGKAAKEAAKQWEALLKHIQEIEGTKADFKTLALADALKAIGGTGVVPVLKDIATYSVRSATDIDGLRQSTENLQRQGLFLTATMAELNKHFATLPAGINASDTAMAKWRKSQEGATKETDTFGDTLKDLSKAFSQLAQISGGAFADLARTIGTVISAMNTAHESAGHLTESFKTIQAGDKEKGFASLTTSIIGVAGALDQATASGSKLQRALGGAATGASFGAAFGPIGIAAGAGFGALLGLLRGGNEPTRADISKMMVQFVDLQGGLDVLSQKAKIAGVDLVNMLNAQNIDDYTKAIDDLTKKLQFQDQAMQTLDETTKKYGFTIADLGPAFQKQQLEKQAAGLYQDFKVLTAGGIATNTVLEKMAGSFEDFILQARQTTQQIPLAMKPMVDQLIKMGLLTDENGQKFETVEDLGLTFTETMEQSFQRLIDSVQKLTDAIARGLGGAIKGLPDADIGINVNPTVTGGPVGALPAAGAASGGRILPFPVQEMPAQSADVAQILATGTYGIARHDVVTRSDILAWQAAMTRAIADQEAAPQNITLQIDGRVLAEVMTDHQNDRWIQGEDRSSTLNALGLT